MGEEEKKIWEYKLEFKRPLTIKVPDDHPSDTGEVPVQVVRGGYIMKFWFTKGKVYRPFVNRKDKEKKYSIMIKNGDATEKIWIWTFKNGITRREVVINEQGTRISHFDMNGDYHTKPQGHVASLYFKDSNGIEIGYYMNHGVPNGPIDGNPYNKYVKIGETVADIVIDRELRISCKDQPAIKIENKKFVEEHWVIKNLYFIMMKDEKFTFYLVHKSGDYTRNEARSGRISNFFLNSTETDEKMFPAVEIIEKKQGHTITKTMFRKHGKPFSYIPIDPTTKIYRDGKPYRFLYENEDSIVVKSQTFREKFVIEEYFYKGERQCNERYSNRKKFGYKTPSVISQGNRINMIAHKFEWLDQKSELDRKFGPSLIRFLDDRKELFFQYYIMGKRDMFRVFNCTIIGKGYYLYTKVNEEYRYVENSDYPSYCKYTLRENKADIILRYYNNGKISEKRYECSLIKNDRKIIGISHTDSKTQITTDPVSGVPAVLLHKPFGRHFKRLIGSEGFFPRYEDDIEFVNVSYQDGVIRKITGLDEYGTELYLLIPNKLFKDMTGGGSAYYSLGEETPISLEEREEMICLYTNKPGYTLASSDSSLVFLKTVLEIGE